MSQNITEQFVEELIKLSNKEIPENVIEQAKMCVIDYIGCAFLGQSMLKKENQEYLSNFSMDKGDAAIIGAGQKSTAYAAALLNGINSHVAELDDGHRYGMMHPGAPVISALLAIAENKELSGKQFIKGVVLGYEVAIRLASAIQPGHKLKGYHATSTCGTVGAAVAIAVALNYTKEQLKAVISAAATDAAGFLEVIDDGSRLKPYNIGRAATAAINAAFIGGAGLNGPIDILGGKRGFLKGFADDVKYEYITDGFGDQYAIEMIYRKPYAACRHCHAAIEAAMNAAGKELHADDIESVQIETYGLAVGGHDHTEIKGVSSAKMSTPYSVAVALLYGKADFQQFSNEYIDNGDVQTVTNKVSVIESPELSALVPKKRGAIATVHTKDGVFVNRVEYPKGEPENPITKEELENKFYSLAVAAGKERLYAEKVLSTIWNIDTELEALQTLL